jgi:DNA-binding MarR family transcriptional regulator
MLDRKIDRLTEMIERIMRASTRLTRVECDDVELTPHQTFLLKVLETQGPMTIRELRRVAHGAQSTTSEMVGRLARVGYVLKKPDATDRRSVKVAITGNGRAILKARLDGMRQRHRAVLEALSVGDQDRFLGAFETIVEIMDRAADRTSHGDKEDA